MFLSQVSNLLRTDKQILNFINGEFVQCEDSLSINDYSPSTGEVVCTLPDSNVIDVDNAVKAAQHALRSWSGVAKRERCRLLNRVADLLEKRSEDLSRAEILDLGTNNSDVHAQYIGDIRQLIGQSLSAMEHSTSDNGMLSYTTSHPVGVVGIITSWAQAIPSILRHLVPALACGNCVIVKPSCLAPLMVHLLAKVIRDSGIPKGVVNILYGRGEVVGRALARHPDVPSIALVGSEKTASSVTMETASRIKRLSYELGNCHAMIVCEDADLDDVVSTIVKASFLCTAGQHPHAVNRVFVHGSLVQKFAEQLVASAKSIKLGNSPDSNVQMAPLISKERKQKVLAFIQGAINDGAKVIYGGNVPKLDGKLEKGFFVEPTILGGFSHATDNPINQMEVFGPVVRIIPFRSENEAVAGANATNYGLSASVWSRDGRRAHRLAQRIQAGFVWINMWGRSNPCLPGAGMKLSGNGRSGGKLALDFYTKHCTVSTLL